MDWNPNHEQEKHLLTLPQSQSRSSRRNELARRLQASLHSYQRVNKPHYPLIEWLLLTYNKVDEVAATEVDFIQPKTKNSVDKSLDTGDRFDHANGGYKNNQN